jgi:chaperone BCS1
MTTNRPEKLDEALIRPGRVDHQVAFSNATQTQVRELFERMYTHDLPVAKLLKSPTSEKEQERIKHKDNGQDVSNSNGKGGVFTSPSTPTPANPLRSNGHAQNDNIKDPVAKTPASSFLQETLSIDEIDEAELKKIAREFSEQVPDKVFSPAEIQGFLLKRKKDPRKSLQDVGPWVETMVEQKKSGTKVLKMQ